MKIVYSPDYEVEIGSHVFPTKKFRLVAQRLQAEGLARPQDFVDPGPASREDLRLVHTEEWVAKILDGKAALDDELRMELSWSPALGQAHGKAAAGTILAARQARKTGVGVHVGGGSHHAFADHGEGFCVFNDLACAIRRLQKDGLIRRAAVVDLDVHHGNGTAAIFSKDPAVATFSMHQEDIYPLEKPPSTLDIGLPCGTKDEKYLKLLKEHLGRFLDERRPELVLYQAGVDCVEGDLLGGLKLTREGLAARDEEVFLACFGRGIPAALTLGGGYAERLEDTVALHARTVAIAMDSHRRNWRG